MNNNKDQIKWYINGNYKSNYFTTDEKYDVEIEIEEFSTLEGIPTISKNYKNYDKLKEIYGGDNWFRRAIMRIPIKLRSIKKKIERIERKLTTEDHKVEELFKKPTVKLNDNERYNDFIIAKLPLYYDRKKKKFVDLLTMDIFQNEQEAVKVTIDDLNKMTHETQNIKLTLGLHKLYKNDESYGYQWIVKKIEIIKRKKRF